MTLIAKFCVRCEGPFITNEEDVVELCNLCYTPEGPGCSHKWVLNAHVWCCKCEESYDKNKHGKLKNILKR